MPKSDATYPVSDSQLVHQARAGDAPAFDELVLRYRKKVYRMALGMARNHSDADDIAQETFLRAYQALPRFNDAYEFKTWLFRIAANTGINILKRKARQVETSFEEKAELGLVQPASPDNPGTDLEQKELRLTIDRAVRDLSPKLQTVWVLRTAEDLSYDDIARVMKISMGTVMSRLSRAREHLRHALTEYIRANGDQAR